MNLRTLCASMSLQAHNVRARMGYMLALVVAGEAVFALPFHVARFFRPTLMEVFNLSATELGAAQGIYGIVAMVAYFPGGPLADRFAAHKLMAVSLWTTAAGGLYMATFPGLVGSMFMFGFFGITTILFFWAALIRATRDWGGNDTQGGAFGLLDGGRGLLAALLLSAGAYVFTLAFPEGYAAASIQDKQLALRQVILGYSAFTAVAGVYVWFALQGLEATTQATQRTPIWTHILPVLRFRSVWLQALIVICAYVGYKGLDNYTLFAVQGYGLDEVEAAQLMTLAAWLRPFAAVGAGLIGDRIDISKAMIICFVLLIASYLFLGFTTPVQGGFFLLLANVALTCIAVYGLRGLYFAVFEETGVPRAMTGTAVGIVSVIGFTPDIFVTLVAGLLIDASPGLAGHQHFFWFLTVFAIIGAVASLRIRKPTAA